MAQVQRVTAANGTPVEMVVPGYDQVVLRVAGLEYRFTAATWDRLQVAIDYAAEDRRADPVRAAGTTFRITGVPGEPGLLEIAPGRGKWRITFRVDDGPWLRAFDQLDADIAHAAKGNELVNAHRAQAAARRRRRQRWAESLHGRMRRRKHGRRVVSVVRRDSGGRHGTNPYGHLGYSI